MSNLAEIGKTIKGMREGAGLSRAALARQVDMSVMSLTRIEAGEQNAPTTTLDRIVGQFGYRIKLVIEPVYTDIVQTNGENGTPTCLDEMH